MSSDRPWSSPATGSSETFGAPPGGTAFGGERPAGSSEASADPGPEAPATPKEKTGRVADSAAAPNDSGEGGAEPAAGSGDRSPPEAGPSAERVAESAAPETAEEMEDPVAVAVRERDEYKDALIRLQADFENYKKRMIKQQTDHLERAAETLVDKLLPVLDTADLALAHGGGEDIKQVMGTLSGVLEREGLERIDPIGGPFDPTLHDAVAHEPGDGDGQQEVVEVLRAGYRWKGRVLRPAMVKVRG
jgi:molecular chaperone GrpE